jgi:hypothetical protein
LAGSYAFVRKMKMRNATETRRIWMIPRRERK